MRQGALTNMVHVQKAVFAESVGCEIVELARAVCRRSMGQVAAVGEIQPKNPVPTVTGIRWATSIEKGQESRTVGLRTRVGLHVDSNVTALGHKEVSCPLASKIFDRINVLATCVVPF